MGDPRIRKVIAVVGGLVLTLVLWIAAVATGWFGTAVPAVGDVLDVFRDGRSRSTLFSAAKVTGGEALHGFAIGLILAAGAGAIAVVVPKLRRGFDQLATFENSVPLVALGPVLLATLDRQSVPVAMSTMAVFFTVYVAVTAGLSKVTRAHADLFRVLGATKRQRLLRVQVPSAIPVVVTSLKVVMPYAIVGAIVGEWFGASGGLGPVMLSAMQTYRMPTLWASAACVVSLAILLYALMACVEWQADRRFGQS
jgi:ABC-type nitrate/sulfonate/bicarbonate transport system permease component